MPVEQREQVTHVRWSQRVTGGTPCLDGRRQPSLGGTSRMNREVHVRICGRLGAKFPGPTRQLKVRDGITISADQPSGVLAVRASQMPSQASETLSALEIRPSTRVPAAFIWKKYPVRRSP